MSSCGLHAGTIATGEPDYSGGARQDLHRLFKSERTSLPKPEVATRSPPLQWQAQQGEILVHEGYTNWHEDWMKLAKFCLAPYGHGWGIRLSIVIAAGCVPLIIQVGGCRAAAERSSASVHAE